MSKITLPAWYLPFETKLQQIYTLVRPKTGNLTVGGSAAIAYMLAQLNMMNELNAMTPPSDLDFMYNNSQISHPNFDNFTKSTESLEKSITYTDTRGLTFDLIFVPDKSPINKIALNGIDILNPKVLRTFYRDNLDGFDESRNRAKDEQRLGLLNAIISKIESDSELSALFFADRPRKRSSIFDTTTVKSNKQLFGSEIDSSFGSVFGSPEMQPSGNLFGSPEIQPSGSIFDSPKMSHSSSSQIQPSDFIFDSPEIQPSGHVFGSPNRLHSSVGSIFDSPEMLESSSQLCSSNRLPSSSMFDSPPRIPISFLETRLPRTPISSPESGFPIAPIGLPRTPIYEKDMDYKSKYIKYKTKYLLLTQTLNKI
jgi:hypothetical protein